jgi:hypothetical protein
MTTSGSPGGPSLIDDADLYTPEFQSVVEALLDVYRPILEEDLKRARDPLALREEALKAPPDCEAELLAAQRLFETFLNENVAHALLPAEAREILGPSESWRWCLLHIRCCMIFGWLLCRRPRNFRLFVYYLYRYWICVRQALGVPISPDHPTEAERKDFETLVGALAAAYKPYLTDQLAAVDFPAGLPDAVLIGAIDCNEGEEEAAAVFERLLTLETAPALLGAAAFKEHGAESWFWFCRCWCLCAIRFGCCLARARNLVEVYLCLALYRRCLRDCFRPLTCALTGPATCVPEEVNTTIPALVVPIAGTAAGAGFQRYVMEWSQDGINFHSTNFVYAPVPPGNTGQGNTQVFGGLLAYLDTTLLNAGTYTLRMTVFGVAGATRVCSITFSVFKKDVRILGFGGNFSLSAPAFDPAAEFVDNVPPLCSRPAGTFEASFGGAATVWGSAYIGGCDDSQKIKSFTLDYKPGYETDCNTAGWTNFWSVTYSTPVQYRAINMRTDTSVLTAEWGADCLINVPFPPYCLLSDPQGRLYPSAWSTNIGGCNLSGLYTIRLVVTDTNGNVYCDTQRVWLDNRPITAVIQIDAVPKCGDLFVSQFANPPDCGVPWNVPISGIAFDEYIDDMLPLTRPNDNFDSYSITVTKQGGASLAIPIPAAPLAPSPLCFSGLSRVGDPGTRCGVPVGTGLPILGTLAQFDLRTIDPQCKGSLRYPVDDAFTIPRGECCVYIFQLAVSDRTLRPGGSTAYDFWPIKICNDLP